MITKDDLRAMRACTSAVMHAWEFNSTLEMKLFKKINVKGFVLERDVEAKYVVELPCSFRDYGDDREWNKRAFFSLDYLYDNGTWQAFKSLIREGDEIKAIVIVGNDGQTMKERDIHDDVLYFNITRNGKEVLRNFELTHSVAPGNIARAVQKETRKQQAA